MTFWIVLCVVLLTSYGVGIEVMRRARRAGLSSQAAASRGFKWAYAALVVATLITGFIQWVLYPNSHPLSNAAVVPLLAVALVVSMAGEVVAADDTLGLLIAIATLPLAVGAAVVGLWMAFLLPLLPLRLILPVADRLLHRPLP